MLRNHLKIALRHLWRNRLFTSLNVLGLSVGMAFVLLIFTIHHTLLTTDGFHQHRDRIYVVQETSAGAKPAQVTVAPLLPLVLQTLPDVEAGTRILQNYSLWVGAGGKEFNESVAYVDPGIFDVFTFPLHYGDPKTALNEPNSIVLSESVSQKMYGNGNAVGKLFQMGNQQLVVRGILQKVPANASFSPNILLPISALAASDPKRLNSWYDTNTPTYLLLRSNPSGDSVDPARREGNSYLSIRAQAGCGQAVTEALKRAFGKIPSRWPFSPFYAQDSFNKQYWVLDKTLRFNAMAAFLTLLLSCAGLFGLSSFATQQRTKEIGIRKVLGANAGGLVWLLSKRMLLRVAISFVLAAPLVYLMMTQWLRTFPIQISFPWLTVGLAGLLAALIAFLTTSYLSIRAAMTNPVESLRTE
jgi:putative ABC transport system permease protein